jgi:hypothetical protein
MVLLPDWLGLAAYVNGMSTSASWSGITFNGSWIRWVWIVPEGKNSRAGFGSIDVGLLDGDPLRRELSTQPHALGRLPCPNREIAAPSRFAAPDRPCPHWGQPVNRVALTFGGLIRVDRRDTGQRARGCDAQRSSGCHPAVLSVGHRGLTVVTKESQQVAHCRASQSESVSTSMMSADLEWTRANSSSLTRRRTTHFWIRSPHAAGPSGGRAGPLSRMSDAVITVSATTAPSRVRRRVWRRGVATPVGRSGAATFP